LLGSGREVLSPLSINSVKYWRSSFKGAKVSGKLKYRVGRKNKKFYILELLDKAYLPCFVQ